MALAACRPLHANDPRSDGAPLILSAFLFNSKSVGPPTPVRRPQPRRRRNVHHWLRAGAYRRVHRQATQIRSLVSPTSSCRVRPSRFCTVSPCLSPATFTQDLLQANCDQAASVELAPAGCRRVSTLARASSSLLVLFSLATVIRPVVADAANVIGAHPDGQWARCSSLPPGPS